MITDMLAKIHSWFGTPQLISEQLVELVPANEPSEIIDLCSGSGGPMPEIVRKLRAQSSYRQVELTLTDLYPNSATTEAINQNGEPWLTFHPEAVDATQLKVVDSINSLCTMICCFHHMPPEKARLIVADVMERRIPMLIFEMTDSSVPPKWLWWIALIPNFFFGILVAAFTRPMTIRRFVFSFIFPIIPAVFAWEGAVSNIRTYNASDFLSLLEDDDHYEWTIRKVPGTWMNHQVVLGRPK